MLSILLSRSLLRWVSSWMHVQIYISQLLWAPWAFQFFWIFFSAFLFWPKEHFWLVQSVSQPVKQSRAKLRIKVLYVYEVKEGGRRNDCVHTQHEHNVKSIFNTYINNHIDIGWKKYNKKHMHKHAHIWMLFNKSVFLSYMFTKRAANNYFVL